MSGERNSSQDRQSFAKFERANDTVGNDAESDAGDLRRVTKIFRISLDDHLFVCDCCTKRKGPDPMGWRKNPRRRSRERCRWRSE